jgi:uncharacterized protein involved in tolerance to divalent cations
MDILQVYQQGSGQMINIQKSATFFSDNCQESAEEMKQITGINTELGRSTKEAFEHIPSRIRNIMRGWSEKKLSGAAKETLIKSVAQAVPTYSMSRFLLSPDTCKKITSAISNYWWSGVAEKLQHSLAQLARPHTNKEPWWTGILRHQKFQSGYAWQARMAAHDETRLTMCSSSKRKILLEWRLHESCEEEKCISYLASGFGWKEGA